ncbi:MAG: hypothetical protein H7A33_05920 [Deltaproteobacteria bacterium]|nr:hypothetical protein [Deltaproteobacteria bacterium]
MDLATGIPSVPLPQYGEEDAWPGQPSYEQGPLVGANLKKFLNGVYSRPFFNQSFGDPFNLQYAMPGSMPLQWQFRARLDPSIGALRFSAQNRAMKLKVEQSAYWGTSIEEALFSSALDLCQTTAVFCYLSVSARDFQKHCPDHIKDLQEMGVLSIPKRNSQDKKNQTECYLSKLDKEEMEFLSSVLGEVELAKFIAKLVIEKIASIVHNPRILMAQLTVEKILADFLRVHDILDFNKDKGLSEMFAHKVWHEGLLKMSVSREIASVLNVGAEDLSFYVQIQKGVPVFAISFKQEVHREQDISLVPPVFYKSLQEYCGFDSNGPAGLVYPNFMQGLDLWDVSEDGSEYASYDGVGMAFA